MKREVAAVCGEFSWSMSDVGSCADKETDLPCESGQAVTSYTDKTGQQNGRQRIGTDLSLIERGDAYRSRCAIPEIPRLRVEIRGGFRVYLMPDEETPG